MSTGMPVAAAAVVVETTARLRPLPPVRPVPRPPGLRRARLLLLLVRLLPLFHHAVPAPLTRLLLSFLLFCRRRMAVLFARRGLGLLLELCRRGCVGFFVLLASCRRLAIVLVGCGSGRLGFFVERGGRSVAGVGR